MADQAFSNLEILTSGLAEPDTSALDRLGMSFHLYSPFLKLDYATYLNFIRESTASFAQPYSISDGDFENDALGDLPWYAILTAMAAPSFSQAKIAGVSMISRARITRVGLTLLKCKEEKGAYPETLSDLGKGEWIDPFSGKSLVYRTFPSGFVVYSLGENQVDDNGTEADPDDESKGDLVWRYPE